MKITKTQLRKIIIEQIEEAKHTDYYAMGLKDGSEGKEKYHSVASWEDEEFDKPNYDSGYDDGADRVGFISGITGDVTGGLMPENTKRKSSMKISKSQLKQIIKEELQGVLQEADVPEGVRRLFAGASRMDSIQDLEDIFLALQAGQDLDSAVVSAVQGDESLAKQYKKRLGRLSDEDMAGLAGVDIKALAKQTRANIKVPRKTSVGAGVPRYSRAS